MMFRRFTIPFILLILLSSCGVEKGEFHLSGEFKNFNQGELYLYVADGAVHSVDTIAVVGGRFTHHLSVDLPTTYVLVFPNYSELPVFAESGAEVTVTGDASHLKEIEVKGTELNKLMTQFRLQTAELSPPEARQTAAQFIRDHADSPAALYVLNRHFVQAVPPDYGEAATLVAELLKQRPADKRLTELSKQLQGLHTLDEGATLPRFSATDINGHPVSNAILDGRLNVIHTWALWNYDSQSMLRKLQRLQREYGSDRLKILSISVDASTADCRRNFERDSLKWSCVCDGRMWEQPLLTQLGLYFMPDNIIFDSRGKILAHTLSTNEIDRRIEELLK